MLKKILLGAIALSLTNCLVLNPLGASLDREKGSVAAGRITDAALQADIVNRTIGLGNGISIITFLASDIAKIESDKYYIKSDVDACVNDINGLKGYALGSLIPNIISCQNINSDGYLIGEPFPSI
ncbi:TIGR04452 family lipoprotein [Leptospira levettii]|uniref:TIGR04452 family lipoprotein n=1 Tax=Leptospira levettii TaxID=2023178 RepID=A0A5F2AK10_9LEPT|nr:TIGR04452 family lipoprotein [Leptospira levettii]PKA28144.1 lipoprotein [Leptospira sp. mixed culture ATI2-C-A1]MCW7467399.1 TIGR04452 family lipoprotein [Leptospira levettii]MCW7498079.1 TIGR04452 family lipoprotein [Leptospira levettii]MCW7513121.1 TIGR04452 family lipoprotein [Leptospira levettii]MCW7516745.1 TIGR04452 family lipoprotein [Leptospira levettii]